jgi:serine phosphatase RsbU (regulator of sigma subunit)/Tfp pilus assembly protein PilF
MLLNRYSLGILFFLCLNLNGFSQNQRAVDSLQQVIKNTSDISVQIDAMYLLGNEYQNTNPDKRKELVLEAIQMAESTANKDGLAKGYHNLGECYLHFSEYDEALAYYKKAINLYVELGQQDEADGLNNDLGLTYQRKGVYEKSAEHFLIALKVAERKNDLELVASIYNNMGINYYYRGQTDKTAEYFKKVLEIRTKQGDQDMIAASMNNLGILYKDAKEYDKALEYYLKATEIWSKSGNDNFLGNAYLNIGVVYRDLGEWKRAILFYNQSLDIKVKLDDKKGILEGELNLGDVYTEMGEFDQAIAHIEKGMAVAQSIKYLEGVKAGYLFLYDLHYDKKDHKRALENYRLYAEVKDSILNEKNAATIAQLQEEYEAERMKRELSEAQQGKKEEEKKRKLATGENKKITKESEDKSLMLYWLFALLVLVVALAVVAYRAFLQKRETNSKLELKNEEITEQKLIIEEKNKDITASIQYAKQIQEAILPSRDLISKALPEHFILFKPRDIVSGDFYWFHEKEDRIFIAAADCTGHGVPGAFVSMMCHNVLSETIIEKDTNDPGDILSIANREVKARLKQKGSITQSNDGMDISLCVFDKTLNQVEFSGAVNSLILVKDGELEELKGDRNPIGGLTDVDYQFTSHKKSLESGQTLYFFSDGYQDQFGGPKGKKFMKKRFNKLLKTISSFAVSEQAQQLETTFNNWRGDIEQLDDICVIGVRV